MHALDLDAIATEAAETLLDFRRFCECLSIATKDPSAPLVPFGEFWPEQDDFDRKRCGRDIVLKTRQIGLTTLELARDLQFACTHDGVQVLIVGHDGDELERLFETARRWADELHEQGLIPPTMFSTKRELVWEASSSRLRVIEAGETERVARKRGRSGTVHRLHVTEVAFWGAADATMTALVKAVPRTGEIVIESTANGMGNRFHRDVQRARAGEMRRFRFHFWPWFAHSAYREPLPEGFDPHPLDEIEVGLRASGCDDEQIAWWRQQISDLGGGALGLEMCLQENPISPETAFRASGGSYLSAQAVDAIAAGIHEPIARKQLAWKGQFLAEVWVYARPTGHREYVVSCDPADGGGCYSAALVMDRRSGEHVAVVASKTLGSGELGLVGAMLAKEYNGATLLVERNKGIATMRAARVEAEYARIWCDPTGEAGWWTGDASRAVMWEDLRSAAEHRDDDGRPAPLLATPDARLVDELRGLIVGPNGKPMHGPGSTDDIWTCAAMAHQLRLRARVKSDDDAPPAGKASEAVRAMGRPTRASRLAY